MWDEKKKKGTGIRGSMADIPCLRQFSGKNGLEFSLTINFSTKL